MSIIEKTDRFSFVCPYCKQSLDLKEDLLYCVKCDKIYPIVSKLPDFIGYEMNTRLKKLKPIAKFMDIVAPIYESKFWYQLNFKVAKAKNSSLRSQIKFHSNALTGITGNILDIACGTATYGRHITNSSRFIYGIDISMGALMKGLNFINKEEITGIQLARARVEELPFENDFFSGAICSGSLHLFPDTLLALREIRRTLKQGATLSVQTFIAGNTLVNKGLKNKDWVHNFELDKLINYFIEAGFERFQYQLDGPIVITFTVRKS